MKKNPATRAVEVFLDAKTTSEQIISVLQEEACASCKITIRDIRDPENARRAAWLGIRSFPTIVMDGKLLGGCTRECLAGKALGRPIKER